MRILFDECLPRRLRQELPGHEVRTAQEMGWAGKRNGDLLRLAEQEFDVFVTVDQKLRFQQDIPAFALAVIVLVAPTNRFDDLRPLFPSVSKMLTQAPRGRALVVGG